MVLLTLLIVEHSALTERITWLDCRKHFGFRVMRILVLVLDPDPAFYYIDGSGSLNTTKKKIQ